jgi:hypothetical protein
MLTGNVLLISGTDICQGKKFGWLAQNENLVKRFELEVIAISN